MTRFGLLGYSTSSNLGDEIQSIAAERFLSRVDGIVDRDHLDQYRHGADHNVIFNGWFLESSGAWPPPRSVRPLMVSFYVTETRRDLLDPRHADWYRAHEPIGCRSLPMVRRFEAIGVRAYFSGCLTLCLPRSTAPRTDEVVLVDCDEALVRYLIPERIRARATHLTHLERSDKKHLARRTAIGVMRALSVHAPQAAWALCARYREQRHHDRMAKGRELLARYARARLVITSRLHCYLPCLAMGTPALLLLAHPDPRFAGLAELGRSYGLADQHIDVNWDDPDPNPGRHEPLAAALAAVCRGWVARLEATQATREPG